MRSKLFTKEIDQKLFQQYHAGSDLENQVVVAKIFNPYGRGTWYLLNSDPDDPDYIWAIVDLFEVEMGSVSRSEMEAIKVPPYHLPLERDLYWTRTNALEVYNGLLAGKQYADGGKTDESILDTQLNEYATEDVNSLEEEGEMAITETKHGVLWGVYKDGIFTFAKNGESPMFSGNKEEAIAFLKSAYVVEDENAESVTDVDFVEDAKTEENYITHSNPKPTSRVLKLADGGEIRKHRYSKGITIELIQPTAKGWKVKQTEMYSGWGDKQLRTPKVRTMFYSTDELNNLFERVDDNSQTKMSFADGGTIDSLKQQILSRAVRNGYIDKKDVDNPNVQRAAESTAEYNSDMNEIGSSDWTYILKDFLDTAGYETTFVNGFLKVTGKKKYAEGGATFNDKVKAISSNLKGKKVPSKYKRDYGQTYSAGEAKTAAKRIAGAMNKRLH